MASLINNLEAQIKSTQTEISKIKNTIHIQKWHGEQAAARGDKAKVKHNKEAVKAHKERLEAAEEILAGLLRRQEKQPKKATPVEATTVTKKTAAPASKPVLKPEPPMLNLPKAYAEAIQKMIDASIARAVPGDNVLAAKAAPKKKTTRSGAKH